MNPSDDFSWIRPGVKCRLIWDTTIRVIETQPLTRTIPADPKKRQEAVTLKVCRVGGIIDPVNCKNLVRA